MCLIDLVYTPALIRSVYAPHHENARAARKGAGAQSADVARSHGMPHLRSPGTGRPGWIPALGARALQLILTSIAARTQAISGDAPGRSPGRATRRSSQV